MTIRSEAPNVGSRRERWLGLAARLAPLLFLLTAGACLRFYDLGYRSLWLDEVFAAQVVRIPDLSSALNYIAQDTLGTPLHYLITWFLRPIGVDEFAIRVPYAIAGLLAVIALYALAARLYGRAIGLVAGTLLAILPYAIFYSQESRSYAFLMLLTTAVMLAAYRAASRGRVIDWAFLAIAGALDLYTGYLAIAVLLAAYAYIGLVLAGNVAVGWRASRLRAALAASARAGAMGVLSAALIGAAFLPWFGNLEVFLALRFKQGFGLVAAGHQPTLDEGRSLLQQLDFHGILFWLLVAGIACAVIDTARGRWKQSLVPLAWFFIPLLGFAVGTGGGIVAIWPRYFGAVYPAAVLLAAAGVHGLARAVGSVVRLGQRALSSRPGPGIDPVPAPRHFPAQSLARAVVMVSLCSLVALDALPADAAAYTRAKGSDYRGAVDSMLEADPGHPVVLVFGENPDWTVSGLGYYNWVRGSRLTVLDALKLSADSVKIVQGATTVWGAVLNSPGLPNPATGGLTATLFNDIWVLRPAAGQAASIDQTRSILSWAASFEPEVTASTRLIEVLEGHGTLGPELLPSPTASQREGGPVPLNRWVLQPGSSLGPDGSAFVLDPGGRSINVYFTTLDMKPGGQYLISFSCRTSELVGAASVFVVADGPTGSTAFPDGAGYQCRGSADPDQGVFAFTMPDAARSATVWLRATGTGSASFERVSLRSLQ
jgi:4-amino-4-deoxy-L-arabinose transferase-like glycosyltransferase